MSNKMEVDSVSASSLPTLTSFFQAQSGDADLTLVMNGTALACKAIARAVRKAGIAGLYGLAGTENSSGDDVKKLDLLSNEMMITALMQTGKCAALISEENEEPILAPAESSGRFVVAFDPLDGSSNIDCNVSTGTIFSVWERKTEPGTVATMEDILRPGHEIVCAGYCMYGSATEFVCTFSTCGVHCFTLDPSLGEFIHTRAEMKIPDKPKRIYSVNEGNAALWDPEIVEAVNSFKTAEPKPFTQRYVGSMVSDVHRTILYGGVFLYPADRKSPNGKLRVLYEGFPMCLLVQQAGGKATTGMFKGAIRDVTDINPTSIHERCPIILGTPDYVDQALSFYEGAQS